MDRRRRPQPSRTPDEICALAYQTHILERNPQNPYKPGSIEARLFREALRVAELSVRRGIPLAE